MRPLALGLAAVVLAGCGSSSSKSPFTIGTVQWPDKPHLSLYLQARPVATGPHVNHRVTLGYNAGFVRVTVEPGARIESVPKGNVRQEPAIPKPCRSIGPNVVSCRASALSQIFVSLEDSTGHNTVEVSPPRTRLPVGVYVTFGQLGRTGSGRLVGGGEQDTCVGGPRDDVCILGAGADHAEGSGGNDRIVGGPGRDECRGGPGTDTVRCESARP